MANKPSYILVLDGWRPVTMQDENDSCNPYCSSYCGGCGMCLLMQASHYGLTAKRMNWFWTAYDWTYHTIEHALTRKVLMKTHGTKELKNDRANRNCLTVGHHITVIAIGLFLDGLRHF